MANQIRLTKEIHLFVTGSLPFEKELKLLNEIVDSEEWMKHLEIDLLLHELFT